MPDVSMREKIAAGRGFVAALDQSGGSSPKALKGYGLTEDAWSSEDEMFDLIHEMRSRIVTAGPFDSERVIAAILFEQTMDRKIGGKPAPHYLWEDKGIVPFLKVDRGLADSRDGVKVMKPIPGLGALCDRARRLNVFGTKMRSVIAGAAPAGIATIVGQQFELGIEIAQHDLVPILEPEVDINIDDKAEAETLLRDEIGRHLDDLPGDREIMLKLTLPEEANLYKPLVDHPRVLKVVALSGGYDRDEANRRLAQNSGVIASFSRALIQDLQHGQSDSEFDAALDRAVSSIYDASVAG